MWIMLAFGSAFFAGLTSILAKVGIKRTDSNLATAIRTAVVAVFAWVMVLLVGSGASIAQVDGKSLLFLVLSGLATGASWLCYFRALQLGDVNKVVPIDKSSTVLTMIFATLFLGEAMTWLKALCMMLIAVGTYLMLERRDVARAASPGGRRWLAYALLSAVFASLTSILGKVGIEGVESNLGVAIRTMVVLVMAWAIVLAQGKHRELRAIDGRSWLFLALSGLATGASWLCYWRAMQLEDASLVAPIDKLGIVVTVAFAWLFLKERLSRRAAVGLAVVVAGTLLLLLT